MLRVITLNLNGLRSASSKGFHTWLAGTGADIVCLQEIKAQEADLAETLLNPAGYSGYFACAEKRGYSGVGIYARREPARIVRGLGVAEFDAEGRYLQADYELADGPLSVVSLYVPSGSSSEERQEAKFRFLAGFRPHLDSLRDSGRRVIVCADWNIAPREIDLKNWKSNQKNSGFLPEERAWIAQVLTQGQWTDAYRTLYPDTTSECYTWWSNRGQAWANNVGWRLDYQLVTPTLVPHVVASSVYKAQRFSDHAPLVVDYQMAF
ncbi:exodeoxyribonuclease III [Uliginosibacterium gangwonense]|uniref:exodeoxyribonuclease III n=1 Tax=Uliginosibacterium gangwonense TaxID=392736 RepID=UPI0003738748|nr:exodeoxyribonuclease III [Uliginosibacterium gangwonense]